MAQMSPFRWLIIIAFAAGLYIVFLFSWRDATGSMVPQQINSVALTVVAAGIIFTADAELNDRRERKRMAPFDLQAQQLAELGKQLTAIKEHLCAGEEPTQPVRMAAVGTVHMTAAPAEGYVNGYLDGVAAQPEAKVLHLDRRS